MWQRRHISHHVYHSISCLNDIAVDRMILPCTPKTLFLSRLVVVMQFYFLIVLVVQVKVKMGMENVWNIMLRRLHAPTEFGLVW